MKKTLYFYKAIAFAIKWKNREMDEDAFAIVSLYEEGKAQRIRMKGTSPHIDFSDDFQNLVLVRVKK